MIPVPTHIDFRANSQRATPQIVAATQKNTRTALDKRAQAVAAFGEANWQALRQAGHDLKLHTLTHLDEYLTQVEQRVTEAGGIVHWASDAEHARAILLALAKERAVKKVVKVKSLVSEEIELNHALADNGIAAFETDLGEYIVQMTGERPSHITAPALHLTRYDIAKLFHDKLGVDAPPDPVTLTEIARAKLREEFLSADMAISGGNFLVAETGTLVLVTNEGNGRMCTSLAPIHVAIVGIEKVVPDMQSLSVLLKLLARSVTGQKLSAYTSFIIGTHQPGPREFHLILLDNGRTRVLRDPRTRETLLCIRCGACCNICPVYNHVGGHAYGWVYPGPIGAILNPQLTGTRIAGDLPFASTLCGACADVCPVKIPIPQILLHLRHRVVEGDAIEPRIAPTMIRASTQLGTLALKIPWLYELGTRAMNLVQAPWRRGDWLSVLPSPLNRWTMARPFPAFRADFRDWWRQHRKGQK